jgi:hypothetical protein
MTPMDHTSAGGPTARSAIACSGAMYWGVPITVPAFVVPLPSAVLAMPKSSSFGMTRPLSSRCRNTFPA